jgi:CheY-like chemotaxis protein
MSSGHILVVDDDWLNIEVIKAYLETTDYDVTAVLNGQAALQAVKTAPPDLIFMDVRMGGMDGYETTAALKADEATRHIPVVMVTALSESKDVALAAAAGADDMLFKPINGALMLMRTRTLIRLKRLHDQLNG